MADRAPLVDRLALARNRARMREDFLHKVAISDLQERLEEVNRTFTAAAVVSGFPGIWSNAFPNACAVQDNDTLDLAPEAHDLLLHGLSLHWANDPVGQLIQCRRALKPDGLFMAVLFGGETLAGLREALTKAEVTVTGGLSPRIAPMAEIRDLGGLMQRAGFALPVADAWVQKVSYPDIFALMRDLRAMGEANALTARLRVPTRRSVFETAAKHYAERFSEDGRVFATFEFVVLTGWAPDASQPKPLRPGSATVSLAETLAPGQNRTDD